MWWSLGGPATLIPQDQMEEQGLSCWEGDSELSSPLEDGFGCRTASSRLTPHLHGQARPKDRSVLVYKGPAPWS